MILISIIYLLPTITAILRRHRNIMSIFWLNLLLGWTVVFWLHSFIWAWSFNIKGNKFYE